MELFYGQLSKRQIKNKIMKKLLLTTTAVLTILFSQAQCQADFSYMQNGPTTIFTDLSNINSQLK